MVWPYSPIVKHQTTLSLDIRHLAHTAPFLALTPKPEYTMLGRTYSIGYEPDLEETLINRPRRRIANQEWPWAVWYPLRRSGQFEHLPTEEQRVILMEHGGVGRAYGRAGYAADIRLSCHGLDKKRQRLRHCPTRTRAIPLISYRPKNEKNKTNLTLSRTAWSLLHRQSCMAKSTGDTLKK